MLAPALVLEVDVPVRQIVAVRVAVLHHTPRNGARDLRIREARVVDTVVSASSVVEAPRI